MSIQDVTFLFVLAFTIIGICILLNENKKNYKDK